MCEKHSVETRFEQMLSN